MGQYQAQLVEAIQRNPFGPEAEMALKNGWISPEALGQARGRHSPQEKQNLEHEGRTFTSQQDVASLRRNVQSEQGNTRSVRRGGGSNPLFQHYPAALQREIHELTRTMLERGVGALGPRQSVIASYRNRLQQLYERGDREANKFLEQQDDLRRHNVQQQHAKTFGGGLPGLTGRR